MRFEILGAVRAWRDSVEVELCPAQQRVLVAILTIFTAPGTR
jgi:hypothetical protein